MEEKEIELSMGEDSAVLNIVNIEWQYKHMRRCFLYLKTPGTSKWGRKRKVLYLAQEMRRNFSLNYNQWYNTGYDRSQVNWSNIADYFLTQYEIEGDF